MNKIFLTVDTECHDIRKENQYIWGKKNGREYGIGRILELGKQYEIPVNFFVDFAEERRYGREYIQRIIDKIKQYNQPIFLHLHPNFISGDESRTFLWEYDKEEQEFCCKRESEYIRKSWESLLLLLEQGVMELIKIPMI